MKKTIGLVIGVVFLGAFSWQVYRGLSTSDQQFARGGRGKPPVAVEVAPVSVSSIRKTGEFTGTLHPRSAFTIAPKVGGRLEKIMVNIGDKVDPGQLVAILEDDEYRQQVSQARAELEVARANLKERENALDNAQREYDRTIALREKKIASESQLDAAASEYRIQQAKLEVARAQVSQEEAALKMAEVRLSYTRIHVPPASDPGYRVVGERFVDQGAMLTANRDIASILDIGVLVAAVHVIERDYPNVRTGLGASVSTDAYPGKTFAGKVVRIAPLIQENSREARMEVEIDNHDTLLKPGMFVRVSIEFDQHDNVTVVPRDALIKRNGVQGLFLADMDTQKAHFVDVTVGIVSGQQAEIVAPPLSGQVVTLGQHLLEDGSAILLPNASPPNAPQGRKRPPKSE